MQQVSKNKIIVSYAKAWLDSAIALNKEDEVKKEVELLTDNVLKNEALWGRFFMDAVDSEDVINTVNTISKKMKFSSITSNALLLIAENSRLNLLSKILLEWQSQYDKLKSIVEVKVESVVKLNASQTKKIKQLLEKKLKQEIKITNQLNEDILGGLRISFCGYQIDDTLLRKLEDVQKIMINR